MGGGPVGRLSGHHLNTIQTRRPQAAAAKTPQDLPLPLSAAKASPCRPGEATAVKQPNGDASPLPALTPDGGDDEPAPRTAGGWVGWLGVLL